MRFRNEYAVRRQHFQDALDNRVHVFDMSEAIGRGDDLGGAVFLLDLARHVRGEVALDGRDATRVSHLRDVGWFDAKNPMTAFLEIRDQRAVVRSDVDGKVIFGKPKHFGGFGIQLRKVVAKDTCHAAGVGIFRRKDDDRIDSEA